MVQLILFDVLMTPPDCTPVTNFVDSPPPSPGDVIFEWLQNREPSSSVLAKRLASTALQRSAARQKLAREYVLKVQSSNQCFA